MNSNNLNTGILDKREMLWDELIDSSHSFSIPEMPTGKTLEFRIYSTWGDKFYVGMAGIELFDFEGKPIKVRAS